VVWGLSSAPECDALTKPFGGPGFIDFPGCDSQHGLLGFVDVWRVGLSDPVMRSTNITRAAQAARLLSSRRGWFQASRQTRTAALS
jgi:hypothetical protein